MALCIRCAGNANAEPSAPRARPAEQVCDTIAMGALTGNVRRLDGSAIAGAKVSVLWNDISIAERASVVRKTMLLTAAVGAGGVYHACNLPLATTLLISVTTSDGNPSPVLQVAIDNRKVRFLDIILGDGSKHTLTGIVVGDNQRPIESALIRLLGTDLSTVSNARGEFRLPGVPAGTQTAEIVALGYEAQEAQVDAGVDGDTLNVTMDRRVVRLESVKTVATANPIAELRYRSFEHRKQNGIGYFVTDKQIADMHVISTDEIMRRVPSVRVLVKHTRTGDSLMVTSTRGRVSMESGANEKPVCTLDVFIDGRRSDVSDIQMIHPTAIHGIEVHSVATLPVEFHSSQCGAVLIWTK